MRTNSIKSEMRTIRMIAVSAISLLLLLILGISQASAQTITRGSASISEAVPPNDGSISITATQVVTVAGDTFATNIATSGTITVNNLPSGLTISITRNTDGSQITISFLGRAALHANANDVINAFVSAAAGSFTTNTAATANSANFTFDFSDPTPSTKTPIGGMCGTEDTECGRGLVCAPIEIGKRYMCRGSLDEVGCKRVFNELSQPGREADKAAFGVEAMDDICATGLFCSTVIDAVNGICSNDFGGQKASELKLGEDTTDIRNEINRVINIFLSFLAIVGICLIIYGGILWATASGNEEQVGKARKTIIAAVIGLIIIAIAWTIISYVINLSDTIS